jgi:hypothetical protein
MAATLLVLSSHPELSAVRVALIALRLRDAEVLHSAGWSVSALDGSEFCAGVLDGSALVLLRRCELDLPAELVVGKLSLRPDHHQYDMALLVVLSHWTTLGSTSCL